LFVLAVYADEYADELCAAGYVNDIESTAAGYQLKVQLPSVFYKYIIGKKGETKKRLESETRTQIKIPRQHEQGDISKLPFLLSHSVFVFIFSLFFVSGPCARLSWPSRQLLSAR